VERYPQIRLDLDFSDRQIDLVAEGFDIAVRSGALADSSLIARPLGQGRGGYFASPAYVKRRGRPKLPRDLAQHDCIVFSGSTRAERWRFLHKKRAEEVTVKKRMVANSLAIVRMAALAGHGIAWLPGTYARDEVARGKLVPLLEEHWPPPMQMQLVYPSSRHLAPQVRAAIELLLAKFTLAR
jgi:DNA-binding transcriptional LysR family regulator